MRLGLSMRYLGYHDAAWRHPDVPADGSSDYHHFLRCACRADAMPTAVAACGGSASCMSIPGPTQSIPAVAVLALRRQDGGNGATLDEGTGCSA